jgi:predicted Zn finger-like uncharacterized protein
MIRREKVKVVCPKCKVVYSIDDTKIALTTKKYVKCLKCQSQFYIQKEEEPQKENKQSSRISFLHSYFEKRNGIDRREKVDRRNKMNTEELSFVIPPNDFIPFFNSEGLSIGFISPGRREGEDRRNRIGRRNHLTD